jgi:hypothetical protein
MQLTSIYTLKKSYLGGNIELIYILRYSRYRQPLSEREFYTNLVFKCRINKLSLSKVCKGKKSLHSLPRVAIDLVRHKLWYYFFNE